MVDEFELGDPCVVVGENVNLDFGEQELGN